MKRAAVTGPYRVPGILLKSKQECLTVSPKTSRDSDESLRYSGIY